MNKMPISSLNSGSTELPAIEIHNMLTQKAASIETNLIPDQKAIYLEYKRNRNILL